MGITERSDGYIVDRAPLGAGLAGSCGGGGCESSPPLEAGSRYDLRPEYDFADPSAKPNPCTGRLKHQTTLRLDVDVVDYFKAMSARTGVPYQTLINSFLSDCVERRLEPVMAWKEAA